MPLTFIEKDKLENFLGMGGGYVLDFTDPTFANFFQEMDIDIDDPKYIEKKPSQSKANRLRGFWEQETDIKVGTVIEKLIEYARYLQDKNRKVLTDTDKKLITDCQNIVNKLTGKKINDSPSKDDFLATNFGEIDFSKLPIENQIRPILESRFQEAKICLKNNANLAAILIVGSILEGALLGIARQYPKEFNQSDACPKNNNTGKPKEFHHWTLSQLIDVGREVNFLSENVKKFSHTLREFRNYIHPHQQMMTTFKPDANTAKICLQVLMTALTDLTNNKPN